VSHSGPVTQEDGTEKEELIDEAKNMSTALCQKVCEYIVHGHVSKSSTRTLACVTSPS